MSTRKPTANTTVFEKKGYRVDVIEWNDKTGTARWRVSWSPDGLKRQFKNFLDYKEAEERAKLALDAMIGNTPEASLVPPSVLALVGNVLSIHPPRVVILKLMELLDDRLKIIPPPMPEIIRVFSESRKNHSRRHVETLRHHLHKFAKVFALDSISDITALDLDEYLKNMRLSPRSQKNHRITLINFFRFAQRKGWVREERRTAPEQTEITKLQHKELEIFTPDEMRAILKALPDDLQAFVIVSGFAGARTSEALRLKWEDWDPSDSTLNFSKEITKTSRRRIVTVEPNTAAWLNMLSAGKNKSDNIVCRWRMKAVLTKTVKEAGVRWKKNGLRHSYASYHLQKYSNAALTSKNCGHSVQVLETVYLKTTTSAAADDFFSIMPPVVLCRLDFVPSTQVLSAI